MFDALDLRDPGQAIEARAQCDGIALPGFGNTTVLLISDGVATVVVSVADFEYARLALDQMLQVEGSSIVSEILDILLRGHKVWSVSWETKVGEGSQVLGRDELATESVNCSKHVAV
jgi:hypothetical protein